MLNEGKLHNAAGVNTLSAREMNVHQKQQI